MELLVELLMDCAIDEEEGGRGRGERRMKFHMYTARNGSERESCLFSRLRTRDTHTDSTCARRLEWKRSHTSSSTDVIRGPSSWKEEAAAVQYCVGRVRSTIRLRYGVLWWSAPSASFFPPRAQDHHAPQKYTTIANWSSISSSPGHAS
jgi:hypothetical protein